MKKTISTLVGVSMVAFSASASAVDEQKEVDAAFASWRAALSSGKAENVVKLYDADAILLATLAAKPITTQKERTKYFTTLTAKPKMAAKVTEKHIKLLDEDDAVVSGLYTFSFEENGKMIEIPAR